MVQMKVVTVVYVYLDIFLYIPHGSDESAVDVAGAATIALGFISHMVQMKAIV